MTKKNLTCLESLGLLQIDISFNYIYTVFWCCILFCKHARRRWMIVNINMFWLLTSWSWRQQCRCTRALWPIRALDRKYVRGQANDTLRSNDNKVADWFTAVWCAGRQWMAIGVVSWVSSANSLKNTHEARPSIKNRITSFFIKV